MFGPPNELLDPNSKLEISLALQEKDCLETNF